LTQRKNDSSHGSGPEEIARAFDAVLALRGILAGTDAEQYLAEERRKDEEKLEAMVKGEDYVRSQ
jgi:hypothetical protein